MPRFKIHQFIDLAGRRRLVYLISLLPVISELLLRQSATSSLVSKNRKPGSFFPAAYGIAPDKNNYNNQISRCQQNLQTGPANDDKVCSSNCYRVGKEGCCNDIETMKIKSKRRRTTEMFQLLKTSFGFKIVPNKNLSRKYFFSKRTEQNCLEETTRLVGGANIRADVEEDPQQYDASHLNPPNTYPDTDDREKSFLRSIITPNKFLFISGESKGFRKNFEGAIALLHKISSQVGPSIITILSLLGSNGKKDDISFMTLYKLALLGASCGFHLFLHFITLGYALGVTLPLVAALFFYQKQHELPIPTILHSVITILWGIRLFAFLAIREYVTWPALHQKVVEMQAKMNIPFASKILCWFLYSFFYITLVAPCWSRLVQSSSSSSWGVVGYAGLSLQLVGLFVETVADLQKNAFKSCNRLAWCNVGVWKYSTHPNYLGEGVFWWGTYLAHGFHSLLPSVLSTVGLSFILYVLKGSAKSLSSKQKEKYGQEMDFHQFQRTHNVFGPKQIWSRQQAVESVATMPAELLTNTYDDTFSISNDYKNREIN
mmetsp:Transcript_8817/g.21536  ORF Transcript_8817/g.21536 Transcript_8817/m.21536 type:complete len:545 (-) Transcript_8817:486-2120(-)